jgi:hypothetical protein
MEALGQDKWVSLAVLVVVEVVKVVLRELLLLEVLARLVKEIVVD